MEYDLLVDQVSRHGCQITFKSPAARGWAKLSYPTARPRRVNLRKAANIVRTARAEGLNVSPAGILDDIAGFLRPAPARSNRRKAVTRLVNQWWTDLNQSPTVEMTIIKWFSVALISLLLAIRLVHVTELLWQAVGR